MNFNKIVLFLYKSSIRKVDFLHKYDPNVNAKAARVTEASRLDVAWWDISHAGAVRTSPEQANMREIMN